MEPEIELLLKALLNSQIQTTKSIGDLAATVDKYVAASDARLGRIEEARIGLDQSIARYTDAANDRMKRIEDNLDGLIRAITLDHSNGKRGTKE